VFDFAFITMATPEDEHKCAICRMTMANILDDNFEEVSSLLCGHTFHEGCLQNMRDAVPGLPMKCPICRTTSVDMLRDEALSAESNAGAEAGG
jgi:hypothetical protein